MKPDVKDTASSEKTSARDASCGPLAIIEAAEDGDDVGVDVPPAVSVASCTRYSIATMETPT